jgi:hypothetical protein
MSREERASLVVKFVLGLVVNGVASWYALILAVRCAIGARALMHLPDAVVYAIGVALAGTFAGMAAEVVGIVGGVRPPWRRRWTVGIAVTMWLFATYIATSLWLHPPES